MRIALITPAAAHARTGNRNTAARWAAFLRAATHRVSVEQRWSGKPCELMIALHARRSYESISRYAETHPDRPLVVVLTGTDLYRDIATDPDARRSLQLATRLVTLQELGAEALPLEFRHKVRVIYQSARPVARPAPLRSAFEVTVSGHLRAEKDPFRMAAAAAHLPAESRVRVTHMGGAMSADMEAEARAWMAREPRYRWVGELPHGRALRLLARSRLMVISSRMEGGANVVSEALAVGVPVIASDVAGNIGMLGRGYPGYYPLGDERALADLVWRAERDSTFYAALDQGCRARAHLVTREREAGALNDLVCDLTARSLAA